MSASGRSRWELSVIGIFLIVMSFGALSRWGSSLPTTLPDEKTLDSPPAPRALGAAERIDINQAPRSELQRLPRIGPALSHRIEQYRRTNGPFESLTELGQVRGIGSATLQALAPHVTFGQR